MRPHRTWSHYESLSAGRPNSMMGKLTTSYNIETTWKFLRPQFWKQCFIIFIIMCMIMYDSIIYLYLSKYDCIFWKSSTSCRAFASCRSCGSLRRTSVSSREKLMASFQTWGRRSSRISINKVLLLVDYAWYILLHIMIYIYNILYRV